METEPSSKVPASKPSFRGRVLFSTSAICKTRISELARTFIHNVIGRTWSCAGNGHHLISCAGPPSRQSTMTHFISPRSSWSSSMVSVPRVGSRVQICIHAFDGRGTLTPMSGECEREGKGAIARYCLYERSVPDCDYKRCA
jgi:hypothetical protein